MILAVFHESGRMFDTLDFRDRGDAGNVVASE
jgi:hypothetical protein